MDPTFRTWEPSKNNASSAMVTRCCDPICRLRSDLLSANALVQYEPETGTNPRGEAVPSAARSEREQPIGGQWRCAGARYHGTGRIRQSESDRARRPVSQAREQERILAGAEPRIGIRGYHD